MGNTKKGSEWEMKKEKWEIEIEIVIEIEINLLFELQYNYIGNTEYKTKGRVLKVPRPPLNKITFYGL